MKFLITGVAGFIGSRLAQMLSDAFAGATIIGIDNLSRRGSETNLPLLETLGCEFIYGDVRSVADVTGLPQADWVLDCAANPSVLAGVEGNSAQVVGHNLIGTLNLLEKCKRDACGFLMLSTSRVYSIQELLNIPLKESESRFEPDDNRPFPPGFNLSGVGETFSNAPPLSIYGATKLASEVMALEYAYAYDFPIWINRCGVIAGAGQFGKIDQGIFSFWIYQWMLGRPLSYIGFGGRGKQVRDFISPEDLASLICLQIKQPDRDAPKVINVGGGEEYSLSLRELSQYCAERLSRRRDINSEPQTRPFDIPYYVTDNSLVKKAWDWKPATRPMEILDSIIAWADSNRPLIEKGF
jgi:CDP-paratose 2-epimerase